MTDPALLSWLREAITARLELARKAAGADGGYGGRAHWSARYGNIVTDEADPDWAVFDLTPCVEDRSVGEHIAANDPASVIARCEAELAILDEHRLVLADRGAQAIGRASMMYYDLDCHACHQRCPCRTVSLLAAGYRHHPGYAEAGWGP